MIENYINSVKKQFSYYKRLGERSFDQLDENSLFYHYNNESNSISIIVNHLSGNMKSRWTDFLKSDGEKEWRNRDQEFESIIKTRSQLMSAWESGWICLFDALDTIHEENFDTEILIRSQRHTITEAINRQMMHYAYHIGQIVYIARMIKGEQWESLSIPTGKSADFNKNKLLKGKHGGHFTDDL